MAPTHKSVVILAILVLIVGIVMLTKVRYSSTLHGRVVDEVSGAPVSRAVVVATWKTVAAVNAVPIGYLRVRETVTDLDGYFELAGWGPVFETASMAADQPRIEVFSPGFLPSNAFMSSANDGRATAAIIPLARHAGAPEEYAHFLRLYGATVVANYFMPPFQCEWRKVPELIKALRSAEKSAISNGTSEGLPAELLDIHADGCRS
jgi:hypothetical protein